MTRPRASDATDQSNPKKTTPKPNVHLRIPKAKPQVPKTRLLFATVAAKVTTEAIRKTTRSQLIRVDKKEGGRGRKPGKSVDQPKKDSTVSGNEDDKKGKKKTDGRRRSNSKAEGTGKAKKTKDVAGKKQAPAEGQKKKRTKGTA